LAGWRLQGFGIHDDSLNRTMVKELE
jgi:hypothetical protein